MRVIASNMVVADYVQSIGDRKTIHGVVGSVIASQVPASSNGLWMYWRATVDRLSAEPMPFVVRVREPDKDPVVLMQGKVTFASRGSEREYPSVELAMPIPPFVIKSISPVFVELVLNGEVSSTVALDVLAATSEVQ
jgi:hypothetical protein